MIDTSSQPLLAAYGTLMRPFGLHKKMGIAGDLSFLSTCCFSGVLYDLGRFPGAVPGDRTVHGELFRLQTPHAWDIIDSYEGYNPDREEASLFVRRQVVLQQPPDQTAWVYWYNGDPAGHPQVPSGNWITYPLNGDQCDS